MARDMPRSIIHVSTELTQRTGVTMRELRFRRFVWFYCLDRHGDDVDDRDPRYTNRDDVKRTLRRWSHPNSQSKYRSVLVSFYDWVMEEGLRADNPARQTRLWEAPEALSQSADS